MSRLNQIQKKLLELGDAAFQKFADAYLYKKGYEQLNSLGSFIGADKVRKSTPDTLISLPNGKYIFAEHTTQQTNLYEKLNNDLTKCFNDAKTGISISKIAEVVFCFTAPLNTSEIDSLREQCQKNQVNLNLFETSRISYDILFKYPGLAKEFLEIDVDTGQIVDLDEFVSAYNKNVLATPLDTAFHFRQNELKEAVKLLKSSDLVIIGGKAGVGKSRFAIECCREFLKEQSEFHAYCIFNRGPDLFTDLQVHFSEPGCYLIFVDDANRINKFDYILQLLHQQNENRRIKLIATTRDYAANKVRNASKVYGCSEYKELPNFEKDQIKQLVEDECGIKNHLYLDRIANIAKGNPRLAIMAGRVASHENRLDSITDVSGLYDEYFSSIRKDIEDLGDSSIVGVAGLVAFFRSIDKTNQEMMKSIETSFGFSKDSFWNYAVRLHETEILDLWENEVVRFSDQVLATYIFYLCFFKQRALSFADLLITYFPKHKERLYDSFYPVLNAFYSDQLMNKVRKDIDRVWDNFYAVGNTELILSLCEAFWFAKETDVLVCIKESISNLEPDATPQSDDEIKPDSNIHSPSILSVLKKFNQSGEENLKVALALIYDYLQKRPADLPKVYYILTEAFGFQQKSYLRDFYMQRTVVETLWERTHKSTDLILTKLQFLLYTNYLQTRFHTVESTDRYAVNIIDFQLPLTPALNELRCEIWKNLFELYNIPELRAQVLITLKHYSSSGYSISVDEIVEKDSTEIIQFVVSKLNPDNYLDCVLVHNLLDLFENHKVSFDQKLRSTFTNKTHELTKILFDDHIEMRNLNLEYEEYKKLKLHRIAEHFSKFIMIDYKQFFDSCSQIWATVKGTNREFQFKEGVTEVLISFAERDLELYKNVIQYYLTNGDPFALDSPVLVDRLFKVLDTTGVLAILRLPISNANAVVRFALLLVLWIRRKVPYSTQRKWLFAYYQTIPPSEVTRSRAKQVYRLYKRAMRDEPPHHLDYLLKYWEFDKHLFIRITRVVLRKSRKDRRFGFCLSLLFNSYLEVNKKIIEIYQDHFDLLKEAFFCVLEVDPDADYNGTTINKILDVDSSIMIDYIHWMYNKKECLSKHDDSHDYSFLWRRNDFEKVITRIVDCVLAIELRREMIFDSYLETFFVLRQDARDMELIKERQDKFIGDLIEKQNQNSAVMKLIFLVIASFEPERRKRYITLFVAFNKRFKDFEKLSLEPSIKSWSGSHVPVLKEEIDYFESLLLIFNKSDLLEHKQLIEKHISSLRRQMEWEKKRDFMDD